ncbi:MAG: HAMP domain-containing sensor histidine kinase [Myxococcota bacterium]
MLRFGGLGSGLAVLVGVGLTVLRGSSSGQSATMFVPMSLLGVAASVLLGKLVAGSPRPAAAPDDDPNMAPDDTAPAPVPDSLADPSDDIDHLAALRHEFRTPLNAVLGFADVLLSGIDGDVNDSQREDLEIIRASGMRLQVLLDSALDLSRLANATFRSDVESTDATEVVRRAAKEANQLWSGKRSVRLTVPDERREAFVDPTRLRRCVLVLADFLATDYRESDITISLETAGEQLAVSIAASPSGRLALEALPTSAEVVGAEDPLKIRRWPVAVSSEVVSAQGGTLYHGDDPARFVIRVPTTEHR